VLSASDIFRLDCMLPLRVKVLSDMGGETGDRGMLVGIFSPFTQ
jgi:hypothetical protein